MLAVLQKRVPQKLLAFEEWLAVWEASGQLAQRGRGKDRYCMSRYGDEGNYELGNVFIQSFGKNSSEAQLKRRSKRKGC